MGKKWQSALCLVVIALCVPGIFATARRLPVQTRPLIEKKYAGWSGVLRIWAYEGWTGGDALAGWLNRCAAIFEKRHGGVYIETRYVDAAALTSRNESGIRPPDMILFPPGVLKRAEGLADIDDSAVRPALRGLGGGYVAPVALGGYGWALNLARLEGLPADWGECEIAAPADEPHRRWSEALRRLLEITASIEETPTEPPGVDLGLPAAAPASDAWTRFVNGELDALPVTQREIARLQRLSDQGRGPDWTVAAGAEFTDQVLYLSIVDGGGERQALCAEFLALLLSDECQALLSDYAAFGVTDAPCAFASGSPYLPLDAALRSENAEAAPAFSG